MTSNNPGKPHSNIGRRRWLARTVFFCICHRGLRVSHLICRVFYFAGRGGKTQATRIGLASKRGNVLGRRMRSVLSFRLAFFVYPSLRCPRCADRSLSPSPPLPSSSCTIYFPVRFVPDESKTLTNASKCSPVYSQPDRHSTSATFNYNNVFSSPMSNSSSCTSSPFSVAETAADLDILDMPMFFPCESPSIYQQIIDGDASADLLLPQQQQQQQAYQAFAEQQKSQQPFPCGLNQIGLGTPPTSPPTPAFHKYPCGGADLGAAIYGSQPQAIQNVYVIPVQQTLQTQQTQQQLLTPQQQQEELAYHMLMQQFDNLESSLFSPSPTTSSCCSSLSNSPYAESPLMAIGSDFDLFPINTNNGASGVQSAGYPSAPVLAPSAAMATAAQAIIYGQTAGVYHQMTPPMNSMDLDRDISLFKSDAINIGSVTQQPLTTELSLLCKCPGKFPCGEQLLAAPIELASPISSPLQEVLENSEFSDESESMSSSEEEENEAESDPSYQPSSRAGPSSKKNSIKARPKSMVISTSGGAPYSSPFSKESSSTPSTPVRQDRRRSSSGSFSSFGGHAHNQQLIDPKKVPEIKDIHVCPVCQRRFTRPFNLRSHLMTHTTARPFPCDECDWKFTRQHDLLRHKRAKHPSSGSPSPTPKKEPTESGPASEV